MFHAAFNEPLLKSCFSPQLCLDIFLLSELLFKLPYSVKSELPEESQCESDGVLGGSRAVS